MSEYEKRAEDFLRKTKTTLRIEKAEVQKIARWGEDKNAEKHINWICTLENKRHKYSFDFWGTVKDWEIFQAVKNGGKFEMMKDSRDFANDKMLKNEGINISELRTKEGKEKILSSLKPSAYDILACLDTNSGDTIKDFCANLGMSEDSIKANEAFRATQEQENNLRKLFDFQELEQLGSIQ